MTTVKQFPKGTVRFNTRVLEQPLKIETDIQKRIQSVVLRDRIRIRQFFHDFDSLRKGTVGQAGFRSAIATLNIHLSQPQITALIDRYRVPTSGLINYRSFCDCVDEVFFDSDKAKNAEAKARSEGVFTQDERETLYETILAIKQTVKANRILLKPTFQDFDRTKSCHITSGQFARVLKQLNLLPPDEQIMTLLSRFYLDKNNQREVNYFRFCRDVDKPEFMFGEQYNQELPHRVVPTPGQNADRAQPQHFEVTKTAGLDVIQNRFLEQKVDISHDPSDIEKRLQGIVLMRRIRIDQFFHDCDKLRKGVVTESQFRRVLSMLKLEFTDAEFRELVSKYRKGDPGFVDYVRFCDLIDSIFTVKKLEKDPNLRVRMPESQDTVAARKKTMQFSEEEQIGLQQVFEGYHRAVKERRVLLKPLFQDFDVPNIGLVTKSQFLRVLHQLGVAAPPKYEQLITKLYMDRGNTDQVNYVEFCKDVDRPEDIFGVGQGFNQTNSKPIAKNAARMVSTQILGNLPSDLDDVMGRIRRIVKQDRIRLKQFLSDYDKLRSGNITITQFRQGLKIAKIELSEREFQCLVNGYISSNKENSVRYLQFCEDVDAIFTKPRLERDPYLQVNVKDEEKRMTMTKYGIQGPNSQQMALANSVLQRFRAHLVRYRLQSKSFFQEWDRHNKYKVTPKQFRQVLASLGFTVSEKQFSSVQKCFGAQGTENDGGYIEYLRFLGDASQGLPDGTGSVTAVVGAMIMQGQPAQAKLDSRSSFSTGYGVTRKPITDLKLLMVELKRYIKVNRIRLREFFQDHDQLRKGRITMAKFRTVLNQQKVDLMDEEFRLLENAFKKSNLAGEELVDYVEMDEQIEKVFTQKGIEKDPTFRVTNVVVPPFLDPNDVLNDGEEKVVHECLLRVGRFVKDHRLLLKPHFQDKDRAKGGFVANTRFRSILDFHKIGLSDPEYELLCRRFRARATNEINYVDFDNILKHYSDDGWL